MKKRLTKYTALALASISIGSIGVAFAASSCKRKTPTKIDPYKKFLNDMSYVVKSSYKDFMDMAFKNIQDGGNDISYESINDLFTNDDFKKKISDKYSAKLWIEDKLTWNTLVKIFSLDLNKLDLANISDAFNFSAVGKDKREKIEPNQTSVLDMLFGNSYYGSNQDGSKKNFTTLDLFGSNSSLSKLMGDKKDVLGNILNGLENKKIISIQGIMPSGLGSSLGQVFPKILEISIAKILIGDKEERQKLIEALKITFNSESTDPNKKPFINMNDVQTINDVYKYMNYAFDTFTMVKDLLSDLNYYTIEKGLEETKNNSVMMINFINMVARLFFQVNNE